MAKHGGSTVATMAERLTEIRDELYDIAECADDIEWRGVQHKVEAALGNVENALMAAQQYESGRI